MLGQEILVFFQSLGDTYIEVYEWQEVDIRKARLANSPNFSKLATKRPDLKFNGLSLAHAVVKADYLDRRNPAMPGLGFLLQADDLINFGMSPIELRPGASKALNDVSSTSLSAQVGQGLAILYGHSLGYKFVAHLSSHVAQLPAGSAGIAHVKQAMADFLFANNTQTVLVEAKGSFALGENNPTKIKSVLKEALATQIDPWMGYLQPAPSNGYVTYACLREATAEPSAMFVVDPEKAQEPDADVPFTPDQVMRENYGAWLRAMGLKQPAARLVRGSSQRDGPGVEEFDFLVSSIDGREYAFFYPERYPWLYWHGPFTVAGLDLQVLRTISDAVRSPDTSLAERLIEFRSVPTEQLNTTFSVFPDGSAFGSELSEPIRLESVRL